MDENVALLDMWYISGFSLVNTVHMTLILDSDWSGQYWPFVGQYWLIIVQDLSCDLNTDL